MSGGVDSSLAAARLQDEGYEVIGVTLQIWPPDDNGGNRVGGCCGLDAIDMAQKVACKLGIPHYVMDFRDDFKEKVITEFCNEYGRGRTPNPCIACNQYIKFDLLLDRALQLGAGYLATGHYARNQPSAGGYHLLTAVDSTKDQSYFLYTLGQRELRHLLFPLGNLTKKEVRRLAAEMGLPSSRREESQDICFIPDNDYRAFIAGSIPAEPGDIVDTEGRVLGRHHGLARYTVGQRQGLGVAAKRRLYVLRLDVAANRLVVGGEEQLLMRRLVAGRLSWVSGRAPETPVTVTAKIRYQAPPAVATLGLNGGEAVLNFKQPQRAIAPGQAVVLYQGDRVLGGGVIEPAKLAS